MKKEKFPQKLKGKGYYVLLFVGVLAIAMVAVIGTRLSSNNNLNDDFVDLNEPDNNVVENGNPYQVAENFQAPPEIVKTQDGNLPGDGESNVVDHSLDNEEKVAAVDETLSNDELLEFDVFTEEEENGIDLADVEEIENDEPESIATTGTTVTAKSPSPSKLSFSAEDGLLWPVSGNVIMKYSMDNTIYYNTLMQYKCNPAVIIDANVGMEVLAAADGVVIAIDKNEETGLTLTMDVGDGYTLVYGQLEGVELKVSDRINEGEVIGTIAEPTRYYTVEGSNLYFQVLKDGETVNPMSLLR